MSEISIEVGLSKQLKKAIVIAGTVLVIIGTTGIIFPQSVSTALTLLIATLLIIASLVVAYAAWLGYRKSFLAWLKPFVLLMVGLLIGFHPAVGAAALGLLLVIYFLLDGFASVSFAFEIRPVNGWGWVLMNGLFSILLAIIFLIGWPFSSLWLIGLFVGISLIFDGLALLAIGLSARKL